MFTKKHLALPALTEFNIKAFVDSLYPYPSDLNPEKRKEACTTFLEHENNKQIAIRRAAAALNTTPTENLSRLLETVIGVEGNSSNGSTALHWAAAKAPSPLTEDYVQKMYRLFESTPAPFRPNPTLQLPIHFLPTNAPVPNFLCISTQSGCLPLSGRTIYTETLGGRYITELRSKLQGNSALALVKQFQDTLLTPLRFVVIGESHNTPEAFWLRQFLHNVFASPNKNVIFSLEDFRTNSSDKMDDFVRKISGAYPTEQQAEAFAIKRPFLVAGENQTLCDLYAALRILLYIARAEDTPSLTPWLAHFRAHLEAILEQHSPENPLVQMTSCSTEKKLKVWLESQKFPTLERLFKELTELLLKDALNKGAIPESVLQRVQDAHPNDRLSVFLKQLCLLREERVATAVAESMTRHKAPAIVVCGNVHAARISRLIAQELGLEAAHLANLSLERSPRFSGKS
ncbi:MAG: hypothetical protein AB7F28_02280 [Candidatus Margulisiibacteriota bacterium]